MKHRRALGALCVLFFGVAAMLRWSSAMAAPPAATPYILTAAPRETVARGERDYGPIAAFLTRVLHHPVVYQHPDGWLTYELWLWKDHADIYFDGPQFMAWDAHNLHQTIGPRVPQPQDWRLYTWKGSSVTSLRDAALGATLCAPPVPNFGTLWVSTLFPNPARQPFMRDMRGWKAIYKAVVDHQCDLGIGPRISLHYIDPSHNKITIIARSPHYPNQGFTISAKLPGAVREAIVRALLSPAGERAMMRLRKRFSHGRRLVAGHARQYRDADQGLDAQWDTIYAAGIDRYLKQDAQREGFAAPQNAAP
ncbi:PhnD/SsuA/transferrin family substrate-binding protein [Acidiferrobacter sp.]|uniref:phosphate/phosphite/phosphonate ABC transporter substrate-binding protein n=1 Tax=Acidiferrobacter sp. TaxID=1872107 RepID=UPI0026215ECC|nr:PhnD/SsuA/transferrin family substrate-binding protein [Acidiferrobacter sp.]